MKSKQWRTAWVGCCWLGLALSVNAAESAANRRVVPPPMPKRAIAPSTNALPGEQVVLSDRGTNFTLFLPRGWRETVSMQSLVSVHFHTTPWFPIQEHIRRGAREPLLCFALGEGSTTYRLPFEDTNRFGRVLRTVEAELKRRGAPADTAIGAVDISSFSAGYGAVRELVKSPEWFRLLRRVALLDSMYAGLAEPADPSAPRRVAPAQIEVWVPLARAAMRGEKTFVVTHSAVPTARYASSGECAAALLAAVGGRAEPVEPGSLPATRDPEYPLRTRFDSGRFHVWGYGGEDAHAHMTHARHLADVWLALEAGR